MTKKEKRTSYMDEVHKAWKCSWLTSILTCSTANTEFFFFFCFEFQLKHTKFWLNFKFLLSSSINWSCMCWSWFIFVTGSLARWPMGHGCMHATEPHKLYVDFSPLFYNIVYNNLLWKMNKKNIIR